MLEEGSTPLGTKDSQHLCSLICLAGTGHSRGAGHRWLKECRRNETLRLCAHSSGPYGKTQGPTQTQPVGGPLQAGPGLPHRCTPGPGASLTRVHVTHIRTLYVQHVHTHLFVLYMLYASKAHSSCTWNANCLVALPQVGRSPGQRVCICSEIARGFSF